MASKQSGAFGSRKGIPLPPVAIQGNNLKFSNDPKPWIADYRTLGAQATALTTSAGMVLRYVQSDLLAKTDVVKLNADLVVLKDHVAAYKGRLALLNAETDKIESETPKITMNKVPELLNHAEAFQIFMNDWARVVMFAADKVLDHFRAVGEDIAYVCPYSEGFQKAVGEHQMDAATFEAAQVTTAEDLQEAGPTAEDKVH